MPTPTKGPRLGGGPAHERLILANLASSLFEHKSITTTVTKAKRMRPLAERMITFAKRGDLSSRRRVVATLHLKGEHRDDVLGALYGEIAPAMSERQGGYTRITKIGNRKGDNAPMAVIELVMESSSAKQAVVKEAAAATKKAAAKKAAPAKKAAEKPAKAEAAAEEAAEIQPVADVAAEAPAAEAPAAAAGDGPYGAGSAAPNADGSAPAGFDIKGNADSMKYHLPGSRWYDNTVAEAWFNTEEAAIAAGFTKAGARAKKA